ncbi:sulfotransferase family 2 domain-containing protein [Zhongshania guokunii]|uniref:Sulfotransferase family 2 domain-containing protein n=1 Tax=Zhongshania guokunii TaxID=641783 RepID=A0ABV3U0W0_9GAMM
MVINEQYGFVFVHVPKTGGSSLTQALTQLDGNRPDWGSQSTKHETANEFLSQLPARINSSRQPPSASLKLDLFGFVRNPWDRTASLYYYLVESHPVAPTKTLNSFEQFINLMDEKIEWITKLHSYRSQVEYFQNSSGKIIANHIAKYEDFDNEVKVISENLKISLDVPKLNISSNSKKDYRRLYTSHMVDIISNLYADDISNFGYNFE